MSDRRTSQRATLRALARAMNVQTSYEDARRKRRQASDLALLHALRAMGVEIESAAGAKGALRSEAAERRSRLIQPVVVAWAGRTASFELTLPGRSARVRAECVLALESGETRAWSVSGDSAPVRERKNIDGTALRVARVKLPRGLPMGYHQLRVSMGSNTGEALLIVAPAISWRAPDADRQREWGLFCPVYALRSARSDACGDLTDFKELTNWVSDHGGGTVATLPLLSAFLDEPYDASPYSPVSRMFWNELYVDVTRAPEYSRCREVKRVAKSASFMREVESLRASGLVQYRRQAAQQRRLLQPMSRQFFERGGADDGCFSAFLAENPLAERFAKFRAVVDRRRTSWRDWPAGLRSGKLRASDYDEGDYQYHLYAQFLMTNQLHALCSNGDQQRKLYLDLPIGTHPDGFDVWANQELFPRMTSVGAPPDAFFTSGQDWGFPPMHPHLARASGYRHFIDVLRNHVRFADYLRLDHVMAYHRLFWIPQDLEASEGVYVSYEAEEMYAILCLESHRHTCRLFGENLGLVPKKVNDRLEQHAIGTMYIGQFEINPKHERIMRPPPSSCVASVNTHDMPPFARFWTGEDIEQRMKLGVFEPSLEKEELQSREKQTQALRTFARKHRLIDETEMGDVGAMLLAVLRYLAASDAELVLVNVEDLWLETRWQNIPGTVDEHPNWRHRLRYTLEEIRADPELASVLTEINDLRERSAERARHGQRASTKQESAGG